MLSGPCRDCCQRHEGCHGVCDYYKEYRNKVESTREKIAEENQYIDYVVYAIKRMRMKG